MGLFWRLAPAAWPLGPDSWGPHPTWGRPSFWDFCCANSTPSPAAVGSCSQLLNRLALGAQSGHHSRGGHANAFGGKNVTKKSRETRRARTTWHTTTNTLIALHYFLREVAEGMQNVTALCHQSPAPTQTSVLQPRLMPPNPPLLLMPPQGGLALGFGVGAPNPQRSKWVPSC
jgi:hypothetical protein